MADLNSDNNRRKKKKSFMASAKKHGKQGHYGKGVELKEDEYNYFMTLSKNMKNVDAEEKAALLNGFFSEFTGNNGERYVCNQIISRMVDDLLPGAPASAVLQIIAVLSGDLWAVCTDPFASHVLQTVLVTARAFIKKDPKSVDDTKGSNSDDDLEEMTSLLEFIVKMAKYCYNNLQDFIGEKYASHIIRTLLEVLSGVALSRSNKGSKRAQTSHSIKLDTEHHVQLPQLEELLLMTEQRLRRVADLHDILSNECVSAVYQSALEVLKPKHYTDACLPLASHILEHGLATMAKQDDCNAEQGYYGRSQDDIHPMFQSNASCRLLESVIECSDSAGLVAMFGTYFEHNMAVLVQHRTGNFTVQRLLAAYQDKETFERVSDCVLATVPQALALRHTGVLLALVQACRRLNTNQGKCCVSLMTALECHAPEERQDLVAPILTYLAPYELYSSARQQLDDGAEGGPLRVSLHGALMLQELLWFRKPIKFVKSLLKMTTAHMVQLMQDPRGSHITDAFCRSEHVGEKSRAKLVTMVQDHAVSLACSKHGSRSIEALWAVATEASRAAMCQQLADSATKVKNNQFGAILYSKFNVKLFSKANKQDWAEVEQRKAIKRRKLKELQDSALTKSDLEPAPKKKKKSKHPDQAE